MNKSLNIIFFASGWEVMEGQHETTKDFFIFIDTTWLIIWVEKNNTKSPKRYISAKQRKYFVWFYRSTKWRLWVIPELDRAPDFTVLYLNQQPKYWSRNFNNHFTANLQVLTVCSLHRPSLKFVVYSSRHGLALQNSLF